MKIRHLYIKILLPFVGMLMLFWLISQTTLNSAFDSLWGESHNRETRLTELVLKEGTGKNTQSLEELIKRVGTAAGSNIIVTDSKGQEVVTTHSSGMGKHRQKHTTAIHHNRKTPAAGNNISDGILADGTAPLMKVTLPNGETGFVYVSGGKERDFQLQDHAFLWLLAGAGILALLAIPVTKQITSPLNKLHRSVHSFAGGDFSHRAEIHGDDEIADLAKAFNSMAGKIEKSLANSKELSANVSHELRSPLARMHILQEMIFNDVAKGDKKDLKENIEALETEIKAMDNLVDRILQFSKLDLGIQTNKPEKLDLAGIMADSLERHIREIKHKNIQLNVTASEDMPYYGDYDSLVWLMDNIIGNAVKFTPEGGGFQLVLNRKKNIIHLKAENSTSRIWTDPETLFAPFQRGEKTSVPGSGLGLAIVKRISEQHGGTVSASANNGKFAINIELPETKST